MTAVTGPRLDDILNESSYEPWLFKTMLTELSQGELGIGFIYSLLDRLAERHGLRDVVVVLSDESFGTQNFRLGGRSVTADMAARLGENVGVHCEPDIVPAFEADAVRTACQLALSLHLARFSAGHDPLTKIANRRSFDTALQVGAARSARYGWSFTLVLLDLNDFKSVNDRGGHAFGDYVLREFGYALRRSVRNGDTAARLGGDEFAVILSNAEGVEAAGFIDRLRLQLKSTENFVDFTMGVASSPRDSTDPDELYRIADGRMYENKGVRQS